MVKRNPNGFTIVEVLVAAIVVSVSIIGTVSLVRKAQELTSLDRHRRAARLIIDSRLEQATYQQMNYAGLVPGTMTQEVEIEPPSASSAAIAGTLQISVTGVLKKAGTGGKDMPYKDVVLSVAWQERGALEPAVVTVEKMVSP